MLKNPTFCHSDDGYYSNRNSCHAKPKYIVTHLLIHFIFKEILINYFKFLGICSKPVIICLETKDRAKSSKNNNSAYKTTEVSKFSSLSKFLSFR